MYEICKRKKRANNINDNNHKYRQGTPSTHLALNCHILQFQGDCI